jgi:hypothetical protein
MFQIAGYAWIEAATFFRWARVRWPLICFFRPFCIFEIFPDLNPERCRSKQARCQLSHPSPTLSHPSPIYSPISHKTSICCCDKVSIFYENVDKDVGDRGCSTTFINNTHLNSHYKHTWLSILHTGLVFGYRCCTQQQCTNKYKCLF